MDTLDDKGDGARPTVSSEMLTLQSLAPQGSCLCSLNPKVSLKHLVTAKAGVTTHRMRDGVDLWSEAFTGHLALSIRALLSGQQAASYLRPLAMAVPLPEVHPAESCLECPLLGGVYFSSPFSDGTLPTPVLSIPLTSLLTHYILLTDDICHLSY